MLESRGVYGWGGRVEKLRKAAYQVSYRTEDGGFGIVGYKSYSSEKEARQAGKEYAASHSFVVSTDVAKVTHNISTY